MMARYFTDERVWHIYRDEMGTVVAVEGVPLHGSTGEGNFLRVLPDGKTGTEVWHADNVTRVEGDR